MVKKCLSKKEIIFSIVILTFNEEKNIGILLNKLKRLIKNYKTEIIIIDSQSTDKTTFIIKQKQRIIKNLRLFHIKKDDFNFGTTRNLAVKFARGKYILFISADAVPLNKNFLSYFLDDFRINNKVMAVFGKQIPFDNSSFISQLETIFLFERLEKYVNKDGIFIQSKNHPLYNDQKDYLLYFISNVFACYRRDFLLSHPFKKVIGCEDLLIGKEIIEKGLIKIYDSRCLVKHSHNFNLFQYYKQQRMEFLMKTNNIQKEIRFLNTIEKIKKIIKLKQNIILKIYYLFYFIFYFLVKLMVFIEIKVLKLIKFRNIKLIKKYLFLSIISM